MKTQTSITATALPLGFAVATAALGITAFAVALPAAAASFGITAESAGFLLSAFGLGLACGTAIFGRLVDVYSLRVCFFVSVGVMAGCALICACAGSLPLAVIARYCQGFAGGGVGVTAMAILGAQFEGRARGRAISEMIAVVTLLSGLGSLIGGFLAHAFGWRVVAAIPVASLLAVPFAYGVVRAEGVKHGARFDGVGAAYATVFVSAIVAGLQLSSRGSSALVSDVASLAAAAVSGWLLIAHIRREPAGFVPKAVITTLRFQQASVTAFCLQAAYFAMIFAAPILLNAGRDPLRVGLTLLPAALAGVVMSLVVGRIAARFGRARTASFVAFGSAIGLAIAAFIAAPWAIVVAFGCALSGFAAGQAVLIDVAIGSTAAKERGATVGTFNLIFNFGGAFGTALVALLLPAVGLRGAIGILAFLPLIAALVMTKAAVPIPVAPGAINASRAS